MGGTVSEDAVRLTMGRIEETAGIDWLFTQILGSISPTLGMPWILDIDVTINPLYGHQQGAEIAYNPPEPGRPSNVYYINFVAICVAASASKCVPATNTPPSKACPDSSNPSKNSHASFLPRYAKGPTFTRSDCDYGRAPC